MEWQLIDENDWILGEKVRGIVRHSIAEVWYDEDKGWHWRLPGEGNRGLCGCLTDAIEAAETKVEEINHAALSR